MNKNSVRPARQKAQPDCGLQFDSSPRPSQSQSPGQSPRPSAVRDWSWSRMKINRIVLASTFIFILPRFEKAEGAATWFQYIYICITIWIVAAQCRRSRRRRRREAWSSLRACGPCTFSYLANLSIFYHHYGKRVVTRRHKHTHTRTNIHAAIGTQVTRMCGQGRGRFVLFCMATLFYVNVVIAQQLRKEAGGGYCRRSRSRRRRRSWNWSCSWRRSQRRCLRAWTRILSSASERATSNQATNFQFAPSSASPLSPHHTLSCPSPLSHRSVECAT